MKKPIVSAPVATGIKTTDEYDCAMGKLLAMLDLLQLASNSSDDLKDGTLGWLTMLMYEQIDVMQSEIAGTTAAALEATP